MILNKLKYNFESGRSMVEMLGVLAIIGVLSVGAIAGYSYAMDKYRVNETINDVNMRGIDLVRQVATKQAPDLSDWPTVSQAGYTISEANLSADGEAYFSISGMSQRVCEMVYEGIQNNQTTVAEINEATNGDATDCQSDNNTMTFFFITTAGGEGTTVDELCQNVTCQEGYSCTHGICMSEELPLLMTGGVVCNNKTGECGECEYCGERCLPVDDGTACDNGVCQNGICLGTEGCTDNSYCNPGFYCEFLNSSDTNKTCIKAEFYKVHLAEINQTVYISKDADNERLLSICEAIDKKLIDKDYFMSDTFNNAIKNNGHITACVITNNGSYYATSLNDCGNGWGHAICVDK